VRRKNQEQRREQIAAAARAVLLERGAAGIRVRDVAEQAGISASSLLYYYPQFDHLLFEVARDAIDRYAEDRSEAVRGVRSPSERIRLAIRLGVPTGPDDEESRILYELDALTGTSPAFAVLTASFFDRQVAMYESILELGKGDRSFDLTADPLAIARSIVALEDGLGLQVVLGHPAIDSAEAERLLLSFAETAVGARLRDLPQP
jgi:AcrR family transcriptional regulator